MRNPFKHEKNDALIGLLGIAVAHQTEIDKLNRQVKILEDMIQTEIGESIQKIMREYTFSKLLENNDRGIQH